MYSVLAVKMDFAVEWTHLDKPIESRGRNIFHARSPWKKNCWQSNMCDKKPRDGQLDILNLAKIFGEKKSHLLFLLLLIKTQSYYVSQV